MPSPRARTLGAALVTAINRPGAQAAASLTPTMVLLMAGAFCCPMTSWNLYRGFLSYSDAFFLLAMFLLAPSGLRRWNEIGGAPALLLISGAMFALGGMVPFAIGSPDSDPINAAKLVFSLCIFPLLIMMVTRNSITQINRLLAAWLAGATLSAFVAFASARGVSIFGMFDPSSAGGRASGLGYHPNALGYSSALLAPVAGYLMLQYRNPLQRLVLLGALGLLLYGLHASGSRASLLALMCGLLLPALRLVRRETVVALALVLLSLLSLLLLAVTIGTELELHGLLDRVRESAVGRLLGLSQSGWRSNSERMAYLAFSWEQFQNHPIFGAGYGWLRGAHMHVLAILHAGGLFGLSSLLLWLLALVNAAYRVRVTRPWPAGSGGHALYITSLCGIIIWFVNGGLQPVLPDRNGYILAGVMLALDALARQRLYRPQPQSSPPDASLLAAARPPFNAGTAGNS